MPQTTDQPVDVNLLTLEDYRQLRAEDHVLDHLLGVVRQAADAELAAFLASAPMLYPGDLFQVQTVDETWHAAAVGPGVLCGANRDVANSTLAWDYGTDRVDCPAGVCRFANGRL